MPNYLRVGIPIFCALLTLSLVSCGNETSDKSSAAASPTATPEMNAVTVVIPQGAVGMGPAAFGQNPLVIAPGTMVTWVNNDTVAHTATSNTGAWDSGTINPGQSFTFTFNEAGTFPYFCAIHGQASMSGAIEVVSASPSPSPTGSPTGSPTPSPTVSPIVSPTMSPTMSPTVSPTAPVTPTSTPTVPQQQQQQQQTTSKSIKSK